MFCGKCGAQLKDEARFCPVCGAQTKAGSQRAQEQAAQQAASAAPAPAATSAPAPTAAAPAPAATSAPAATPAPAAAPAPAATPAPAAAPSPAPAPMPAPATAQAASSSVNLKIVIPAIVIALAAIVLIIVLVPRLFGSTAQTPSSATSKTSLGEVPSVVANGTTITALPRPTLFEAAEPGDAGTSNPDGVDANSAAVTAAIPSYTLDASLSNVLYVDETLYKDSELIRKVAENGFCIRGDAGDEFYEQYELNRYFKLPNFVTTDSMMHTYHLYFSHLMKNTERSHLSASLAELSRAMLEQSEDQLDELIGTEWEDAAKRNVAFFAVGAKLLDPATRVPDSVASIVNAELSQVQAASGVAESPLIEDKVDYSQYLVRGYYEGDATLEPYFRAMMWYGQMNFKQSDEDLDRSALLMTLALDDEAFDTWESIYTVTSFFAGASDDCGYYEYYPLFTAAYGENATLSDLAGNDEAWKQYHDLTEQMPAPKINSVVVEDEGAGADHEEEEKGYRFMGQRFSIDASILQQLIYSNIGANAQGQNRMLPNALDVPAALGSDEALAILQSEGETDYDGYMDNMAELREELQNATGDLWNASLYSRWLYTLKPLLQQKGDGYPQFMQSSAWTRKNLQTYLGSYTELKHDTVLYSKQVMAEFGGGIDRTDDRGYVEPEPELYGRLTALVSATSDGLSSFGMLGSEDAENLALLRELTTKLETMANKELRNETLTDDEYDLIRTFGGQLEHFWQECYKGEQTTGKTLSPKDYPAAIVTDIATDPNGKVLELGTGRPQKMYVVVPVDGSLRIASGSVFDFYQFEWPLSDRLTDTKWREMMGFVYTGGGVGTSKSTPGIQVESWTDSFKIDAQS